MKAIIWKEVRELAERSTLVLTGVCTLVVMMLYLTQNDIEHATEFLTTMIPGAMLFAGAAAGMILGFLQTVFDGRRDQWAFLIHRGESATRIFLGKIAAGGLMYAVIMLVPVLICAGWGMKGGIERYPFTWYLLLPMLAAVTAASPFYFAAILAMTWKGLWYVNRILPMAVPVLSMISFFGVTQATQYVPIQAFLAWVLMAGLLGVAAWGVYVRSGEAAGRPLAATICLGVPVFAALFVVVLLSLIMVGVIAQRIWIAKFRNPVDLDRVNYTLTTLFISSDGHVCELKERVTDNPSAKRTVLTFTDLDAPESHRYDSLVGTNTLLFYASKQQVLDYRERLKAIHQEFGWNPLPAVEFATSGDSWWAGVIGYDRQSVILEEIGTQNLQAITRWIYSSADGLIYGYTQDFEIGGRGPERKPPRLTAVVSPDGFVGPEQRPRQRFSRVLMSPAIARRRGSQMVWPQLSSGGPLPGPGYYLVCEDGLYCLNVNERAVYPLFATPVGKKIRGIRTLGEEVVVIYSDSISVHEYNAEMTNRPPANPAGLPLPGKLKYSVSIPGEMQNSFYVEFGKVADRPELVFASRDGYFADSYQIVWMQMDGTILSSRQYGVSHPVSPRWTWLASVAMLIFPVWVVATGLCLWSVTRTARRHGFSVSTRRLWQGVTLVFGPVGMLTLWFLRDWSASETCKACRKARTVELGACPYCGEAAPAPPANGTEILIAERKVVPQLV